MDPNHELHYGGYFTQSTSSMPLVPPFHTPPSPMSTFPPPASAPPSSIPTEATTSENKRLYNQIYDQSMKMADQALTISEQTKEIKQLSTDLGHAKKVLETLQSEFQSLKSVHESLKEAHEALKDEALKAETMLKSSGTCVSPSSISPSDSVSQTRLSEPSKPQKHPAKRPSQYPPTVIWDMDDLKTYTDIKVSEGNKGRPPIKKCICSEDGLPITKSEWIDIQHSASGIFKTILHPLAQDATGMTCRKKYFKTQWPQQWNEAVCRLETQQPLLQLCSQNWKAELVLLNALDASSAKSKSTPTAGVQAAVSSPPAMGPPPVPSPSVPPPPSPSPPIPSPSPPPASSPPPSQITETSRPDSPPPTSIDSTASQAQSYMSPLKHSKHKRTPTSPVVQTKKRRFTSSNDTSTIPDIVVTRAMDTTDDSSINISASYENLKSIFTDDSDYKSIPNGLCLLEALYGHPEELEAPSSPAVQEFLAGIEQADPNSVDADEDNTNASWGHGHFRSGIGFSGLTWEQVANKQTAYRILAATIKTSRIARHLCHKRNVPFQSVLADMYLEVIVGNLWKDFQTAAESPHASHVSSQPLNISEQGQLQEPDSGSLAVSETRERSKLKKLRVGQLQALVEDKLRISVYSKTGKRISKDDYLTALASVSLQEINKHMSEI